MSMHVGDAELDAYADGEVEAVTRLAIQDHVKGCEQCRDRVEAVVAMKSALVRHWGREAGAASLRGRVIGAVEAAARGRDAAAQVPDRLALASDHSFEPGGAEPVRRRVLLERPWVRRAMAMSALAAAIVAALVWWRPVSHVAGSQKLVVVVPDRAVLGVREAHAAWERESAGAGRKVILASSSGALAEQLSSTLELDVAVPDFSASGFALVGGGISDVAGLPAAHVKYLRERPVSILSFFTTLRNERMSSTVGDQKGGREFFVSRDDSQGTESTVVAWNSGQQTYAVCAHLPREDLMAIVTASRIAVAPPLAEPVLLASAEVALSISRDEVLAAGSARPEVHEAGSMPSSSTSRANRGTCLVKAGLAFWAISQMQ